MSNKVDAVQSVEGYKPSSEFEGDKRELLTDISLSDSTELWLIQWPANQAPEFDGQELSLQLDSDGHLGSFLGSSGKSYDVVSCVGQEPEATVFLPSSSDAKIIGKISRRVSLVHFPEPEELEMATPLKPAFLKSSSRGWHSSSGGTNSARSSKPRSSVAEFEGGSKQSSIKQELEPSESRDYPKKDSTKSKQKREASRSTDHSTQDSGCAHSAVTLSGSPGQSSKGKTKKQKK